MQGDEEIADVLPRELRAGVEGEPERRGVRRQLEARARHAATLARVAERRIDAEHAALGEAPRPAVGGAPANLRHVVGRGGAAGPVALVHARPQRAGRRLKPEPDRIAQAAREALLARAVGVVAHDGGAARIALLAHVARRPDGHVQLVVGAEGDGARPVMRAVRQPVDDDRRLDGRLRRRPIAIADDASGLGDVEMAVSHRESVRQIEVLHHGDDVRRAPAATRRGQRHHATLRRDRRQHHAVGIHRETASAAELFREDVDAEPGGHGDFLRAGHADAQQHEYRGHPPRRDGRTLARPLRCP